MFTKRQREIVEHAYKTTKFYKKLENKLEWDNIKGMEDFPFTCKDNLVLQNEEFISDCYVAHGEMCKCNLVSSRLQEIIITIMVKKKKIL